MQKNGIPLVDKQRDLTPVQRRFLFEGFLYLQQLEASEAEGARDTLDTNKAGSSRPGNDQLKAQVRRRRGA